MVKALIQRLMGDMEDIKEKSQTWGLVVIKRIQVKCLIHLRTKGPLMVLPDMLMGIILQGHILEIDTRVTMASIILGLMVPTALHSLMVLNKEVIGKAGVVIQTINRWCHLNSKSALEEGTLHQIVTSKQPILITMCMLHL